MKDHFATTGARFVFIVTDSPNAERASAYLDYYGVDFGFRTNDADNTAGTSLVVNSVYQYGVPWVGVIRASDMMFYGHDGEWGDFDLRAIAQELAM